MTRGPIGRCPRRAGARASLAVLGWLVTACAFGQAADPSPPAAPGADAAVPAAGAQAPGGSPEDRFRAGGRAYEEGRYDQAAEIYEALLGEGFDDGRVHYNLGNARFKLGKLGPAILSYERALERNPSDADARENLAYADLLIVDKVGAPEEEFPARFLKGLANRFDANRATRTFAGLVLLAGFFAAPLWLQPRAVLRRTLAAAAGIAGTLALICGLIATIELTLPRTEQAIVLAPSADGRSSPAADGTVLFTVHEGLKVEIRGERPGWIQIGVPNGLAGWIEASQAERI